MTTNLPGGYRLERDADELVLRAEGGCFVAAFSVAGMAEEAVWEAAWDDLRDRSEGDLLPSRAPQDLPYPRGG